MIGRLLMMFRGDDGDVMLVSDDDGATWSRMENR